MIPRIAGEIRGKEDSMGLSSRKGSRRYTADQMVSSTPRERSKRKDASAERRRAILDAARTVFARQGYTATVVEDIAKHVEIGKGTLYLYFPSKEQIYL